MREALGTVGTRRDPRVPRYPASPGTVQARAIGWHGSEEGLGRSPVPRVSLSRPWLGSLPNRESGEIRSLGPLVSDGNSNTEARPSARTGSPGHLSPLVAHLPQQRPYP